MRIRKSHKIAILTKYLGPTNYRGSRVKAYTEDWHITLSWDHALNSDENHAAAALALCKQQGWDNENELMEAWSPTGGVFVFSGMPERNKAKIRKAFKAYRARLDSEKRWLLKLGDEVDALQKRLGVDLPEIVQKALILGSPDLEKINKVLGL